MENEQEFEVRSFRGDEVDKPVTLDADKVQLAIQFRASVTEFISRILAGWQIQTSAQLLKWACYKDWGWNGALIGCASLKSCPLIPGALVDGNQHTVEG